MCPVKLILIQPPVRDFYQTGQRLFPLGLCYLKAALSKHFPEARATVWDRQGGHGRKTVGIPRELAFLRDYYRVRDKGPFSAFSEFYHFGADYDSIAEEVARASPALVGISSLFSAYHGEVVSLARAIKKAARVPVVAGGHHATAAPETLLADGAVDFVVLGEGERPLVELAKTIEGGSRDFSSLPNLAFLEGGKVTRTALKPNYPVEGMPPPDFSDLDPDVYRLGRDRVAPVTTSRGCPSQCAFCSVSGMFGHSFRRRPAKDVLAEVSERKGEGYRVIDFEDDNLALDRRSFKELLSGLAEINIDGSLNFQAMNGISYWTLDRKLLTEMRNVGFTHLNLSLVSADDGVCRSLRRPSSVDKFSEVVETAFELGFYTVAYQILGLPGESLESQTGTLALLARLPVLIGVSPFYLVPRSALAPPAMSKEEMVQARLTALGVQHLGITRDHIYTLFLSARIFNFLKGLPSSGNSLSLREALGIAEKMGGIHAIGAHRLADLLETGILKSSLREGGTALDHFDGALFSKCLKLAGSIGTRDGGVILVE